MRRIIVSLISLIVLLTPYSLAASEPFHKLERGIVNIVSAPLEIPKEIRSHWIKGSEKTYHIVVWIFCGLVKGTVMTTVRVGSGVWDVVSAPVPIPKEYQPILKPDYVLDDWPQRKEGVVYKNVGDK